jgi:ferredoxin, 2Fe-2S
MIHVVLHLPNGETRTLQAEAGQSLMQVAFFANVPGIIAECGGNASCGTCHVLVNTPWSQMLQPPSAQERMTLANLPHCDATSRLSCCLLLTPALNGIEATVGSME